jgi:hypothetical protein
MFKSAAWPHKGGADVWKHYKKFITAVPHGHKGEACPSFLGNPHVSITTDILQKFFLHSDSKFLKLMVTILFAKLYDSEINPVNKIVDVKACRGRGGKLHAMLKLCSRRRQVVGFIFR